MSAEENPQTVTGVVTDPEGNPLEGVVCVLKRQSDNATFETTTDANGNYSFTGLPNGTYHGVVRYEDSRGNLYTSTNKPNIEVIGELPVDEVYYQRNYGFYATFTSLDKDDYSVNWSVSQGRPLSSWCTENGSIYTVIYDPGTGDESLYSIDSTDGSTNWTYTPTNGTEGSPRVKDGVIFISDGNDQLLAIQDDGGSASQKWVYGYSFGTGGNTVSYGGGSLYTNDTDALYSIDPSDGFVEWNVQTVVEQIVAYYDGTLYSPEETAMRARDPANGNQIWEYAMSMDLNSFPAVTDDAVYATSGSGELISINRSDGSENWVTSIGSGFNGGVVVYDGVVYLQNYSDLHAVNANDGSVNWTFSGQTFFTGTPAITGDINGVSINLSDGDGRAYEVSLDGTGEVVYNSGATSTFANPLGASDGWSYSNAPTRTGRETPLQQWWEKFL